MPFCIAPCSVRLFCLAVGTEKQRGCNFEAHVYHVRYRLDCISSLLVYSLSCLTWSYTSARWRLRAPKIFIYEDRYDVRASQSYNLFVSQSQQHGEKLAHADGGHRWETLNISHSLLRRLRKTSLGKDSSELRTSNRQHREAV